MEARPVQLTTTHEAILLVRPTIKPSGLIINLPITDWERLDGEESKAQDEEREANSGSSIEEKIQEDKT